MLTKFNISYDIREVLEETIPRSVIQQREGGGHKVLYYVSGNFVIDQLNRAFNYAWSWSIDKAWIQPSEPKIDKYKGNESIPQPPVAHVIGTLTVFLKDTNGTVFPISKTGTGSKVILGGAADQDSVFKAAATDAIKKAASLLGLGAQLYRDKNEQEYFKASLGQDTWDEQITADMKADMEWLLSCMKENDFSDDFINSYVKEWSNNEYSDVQSLPPYALKRLVGSLKAAQQEAAAQQQREEEQ